GQPRHARGPCECGSLQMGDRTTQAATDSTSGRKMAACSPGPSWEVGTGARALPDSTERAADGPLLDTPALRVRRADRAGQDVPIRPIPQQRGDRMNYSTDH